jgi:hypothetical protein
VSFSATELRQFIEALGLSGAVALDRGMQEMARLLVRHFERQGSLEALVTRLKQARPLMEWPEPSALPAFPSEAGAPASPPLPAGPSGTIEPNAASPPAPALGSSSAAWPTPNADTRILADPYASPGAPAAPMWPGTVASPQTAAAGAGPRSNLKIWLIVAAMAVLVAIAAFAIGRASTPPEGTAGSKVQSPAAATSAGAAKREGAAAIALGAIDRSLANVARACEIPVEGTADLEIFRRMTQRCGSRPPLPRQGRPAPAAAALPDPSQSSEPVQPGEPVQSPNPTETEASRAAPPAQGAGPKPLPAAPNAGCLSGCEAKHRACKQGCGAEPKQSSQYTEYQACLGKCLSGDSRCKLGCN